MSVFDEYETELGPSEFDPVEISNSLARWEAYIAVADQRLQILQLQRNLLVHQDQLDQVRDRLGADGMTQDEFEKLKLNLTMKMSKAELAHVPGMERGHSVAIDKRGAHHNPRRRS